MTSIIRTRNSIQFKYTSTMTMLVLIAVLVVTALAILRERANFRNELQEQASLLLTGLALVSDDALYLLDAEYLGDLMDSVKRSEFVSAQIYDAQGRIIADSDEPGNLVYNAQPDSYGEKIISNQKPIFRWGDDHLLAGRSIVAGNEIIGAVSVTLPTSDLDEKITATTLQGIAVVLVIIIMTPILSFLTTRRITQPLEELTHAAVELGSAGYTRKVDIPNGNDELTQLAEVFNRMSSQLSYTITQLHDKAVELEQANQQIEEALLFKSRILSSVSHDARTPLSVILMRAEMIMGGRYGELTEKQQQVTESIFYNAKQLLFFVNNLLDGAQLEANKLELYNKDIEVVVWLEQVSNTLSPLAEKKHLTFTVEQDSTIPATLYGDANRLNQIIFNLVGNALKFTNTGGVSLRVFCPNKDQWALEIQDTGAGIPDDAKNRLFETFYQVDGTGTQAKMQGIGLGLSIVKQLVDLMDGHITVESTLNIGSTFTVTLPYQIKKENIS